MMLQLQFIQNKLKTFYEDNPRAVIITISLTGLYIVNKVYKKWKYSQKIFNDKSEIKNKVILITGCDTGFGNAIAMKLSVTLGYQVIATCFKQESVDKFLSNSSFTANNSIATVLDVTNDDNIKSVKQFTINHLKNTSILWGIVNNAGITIAGQFEVVPKKFDLYQRNVLFNAPLNIIREFLPLLPGRKNYKTNENNKTTNNGGRIVNISSAGRAIYMDTRYGVSKCALSYFSHSLRMELSPKFGIWVCPIEPAGYLTGIYQGMVVWGKKVENEIKENNRLDLIDAYGFDMEKYEELMNKMLKSSMMNKTFDDVVDDVIHGLTAQYPQREYRTGWNWLLNLFCYGPWWMVEPILIKLYYSI